MQHFQAAILLQQFDKLQRETRTRRENADYLISLLETVPGIKPARIPQDSRAVWHLFPLRYDARQFHGLTRRGFLRALNAEGVPCSGVYHEQYNDGLLDEAIESRGFRRLFGAARLKAYRESFRELRGNRQVCRTTVALPQTVLLSGRREMDQIAAAIRKIQSHSGLLGAAELTAKRFSS